MIRAVGLDADDTLWDNEAYFHQVGLEFVALLERYRPGLDAHRALVETELQNVALFGYGVKGFVLSMIETALRATDGEISPGDIQWLIDRGKFILGHPVELLPGVAEVVPALAEQHHLVLITKGDLHHQEGKILRSGLADHFAAIEIVTEKDPETYARVLKRHGLAPEEFVMVGNSLKSDVLPVLELGGYGVHVPFRLTWALEVAEGATLHEVGRGRTFWEIEHLGELPALLAQLSEPRTSAETSTGG